MSVQSDDAVTRMNRMYRHQRRIYDLTRRYYLLGRTHLVDRLTPPDGGSVLEVGCGTASNLIASAQRYPRARHFGFDISSEMLLTARQSVERRGFSGTIELAQGDATRFDTGVLFDVPAMDRIFTSYTLSMIADWPSVLGQMARQLKSGGRMHVVDFGDCAGLPSIGKTALYRWLTNFDVTPRLDLKHALQGCAEQNALELSFMPLYRGYAQYAELRRR